MKSEIVILISVIKSQDSLYYTVITEVSSNSENHNSHFNNFLLEDNVF